MLIIIYLLEDGQELSLGMLIRLKRIDNFRLLHACFVCYFYDLDTLSYTFDHIWTNLLTQCTTVPVPVYCCFSISVFPHIKSAPNIRENQIKNKRRRTFRKNLSGARGPPSGAQAPWWHALGAGRARGPPGPLVPPWLPPFAYIFSVTRNPQKKNPFSRSRLCSAAAALPRSGAPADLFPAPCRREGRPPGVSSPPWMLPGCAVSSFFWTMGP